MSKLRGRFDSPLDDEMQRYCSSLRDDRRMLDEDIDGSLAHAVMLAEVGLISTEDGKAIARGLEQVRAEARTDGFANDHDDIHMAVESRLIELVGEPGLKLHTARSRNDQVATDVRLWLKRRLERLDAAVTALVGTLLDRVEADGKTLIPGFTHLQRGQPIWLGHHLLAHCWALTRDRERLADARRRLDRSPLGACALAGTPHPIRRERTAELLGFEGIVENAMDAVASRDHEQEVVAACAITMGHLSRMGEELVLWSSVEFSLVELDAAYATGSSIMPQKRNPDAAELVRGKAAVVAGQLQSVLNLTRAMPLAYNRDLQESRAVLFDAVETTLDSVSIMERMWSTLAVNRARYTDALRGDFCLATELADLLATRGVPFRDAHEIVGNIVRWCEEQGSDLSVLTSKDAARFHEVFAGEDLDRLLDPPAAVERRDSVGGTAWSEVMRQVGSLRASLAP